MISTEEIQAADTPLHRLETVLVELDTLSADQVEEGLGPVVLELRAGSRLTPREALLSLPLCLLTAEAVYYPWGLDGQPGEVYKLDPADGKPEERPLYRVYNDRSGPSHPNIPS